MTTLDDTDLGRPARHVRPEKRSEPRAMGAVLDAPFPQRQPKSADEIAEDREWEREIQRELAARRREVLLRTCAIPAAWRDATWAELERDGRGGAIAAAMAWARGEIGGLLLWGRVGRGKTRIAATAALARLERGPVRWLNVADLIMDLRGGFGGEAYERAQARLRPGVETALVLDDLDKLRPTDHAVQPLYLAVNGFVEARLPLIVTMNRDLDDLAVDFGERFGEAIASRLAGYCEQFEIAGRDRRLDG